MPRRFLVLVVCLLSCLPKEKRYVITESATGIPILIINRTATEVTSMEISGANHSDFNKVTIKANGGRLRLLIDPDELGSGHKLGIHLTGKHTLLDTTPNDHDVVIAGPTEIVVVETKFDPEPVTPGYKRVLALTWEAQQKLDHDEASRIAAHEELGRKQDAAKQTAEADAKCQPNLDAAHGKPHPGTLKARGKYKCVFGGAFTSESHIDLVQLANGKITATVTEYANGAPVHSTWDGIVVGNTVRFAYANNASAGSLEMDPGGHAMIGGGTSRTYDTLCQSWTLTCTR